MSKRLTRWRHGLFAALLALAAQMASGVWAPDVIVHPTPDQQLAVLLADPGAICHSDAGGGQTTPHHHAIDCGLCPFCVATIGVVMLRADAPALPVPRAGHILVAIAAPHGDVASPLSPLAPRPRGPPILA